jgi:hypothetical protein
MNLKQIISSTTMQCVRFILQDYTVAINQILGLILQDYTGAINHILGSILQEPV